MASTKFEISKKDRNGASELMVRFCYDRKHSYRLHTLIWVPQTAWNASKLIPLWPLWLTLTLKAPTLWVVMSCSATTILSNATSSSLPLFSSTRVSNAPWLPSIFCGSWVCSRVQLVHDVHVQF